MLYNHNTDEIFYLLTEYALVPLPISMVSKFIAMSAVCVLCN